MPQTPLKRTRASRAKRARKISGDHHAGQPRLPAPWEIALARVKRHIQTESRQRGQEG